LTQASFAELLKKNYVGSATPERGRFRSFLLTAFKHFLGKEWEKAKAHERGGGRAPISLDFQSADSNLRVEPAAGLTAEQFYEQQSAISLLARACTYRQTDGKYRSYNIPSAARSPDWMRRNNSTSLHNQ
jgi:hypothetical protein